MPIGNDVNVQEGRRVHAIVPLGVSKSAMTKQSWNRLGILGIVFSRDRAMQLDATLSSFFLHCKDASILRLLVIYKATSDFHARQYTLLARQYHQVGFIEQRDFRRDVLELLISQITHGPVGVLYRWLVGLGPLLGSLSNLWLTSDRAHYVLLLVDDNIFVRDFSLRNVQDMLEANPKALGFSLRLGTNTKYCYPLDRSQQVPPFTHLGNGVIIFNWSNAGDSSYDFGYPLELSSSVYRINELLPLLNRLPFQDPNTLEGRMATNAHKYRTSNPYLLCYERSVTFCTPANRVQTVCPNRAGVTFGYSTEYLAKMFDDRYRIKVEAYSDFVPNACHQEVELLFERRVASQRGIA
jgi:hypothetical protein